MVDGEVRVAGVELALHAEETRLHEDGDLVGEKRHAAVAQGVVLPEGRDAADAPLVLVGDVEHVAVALLERVQLVEHEAQGVLREDRRVAVLGGLVAGEEGLVLDVDAHVVEDVREGKRATHDGGLVLRLAVGLGAEHGALGVDERPLVEDLLAEGPHACGQCPEVLLVLHGRYSFLDFVTNPTYLRS